MVRRRELMHGKTSTVHHDGAGVFRGVTQPFAAGRYHSLVDRAAAAARASSSAAHTEDGTVMGVRHRALPIHGVQFHPESVLTGRGTQAAAQLPGDVMFAALIEKLQRREDLTVDEAAAAMDEIMDGRAQPAQIAGLLIALAMKGERPAEIVGLARTMRARATKLSREYRDVFDTCGTGGDRAAHLQRLDGRGAGGRGVRRDASPSTATARSRAGAAAPTSSRRWASTSRRRRPSSSAAWRRPASRSSSRRRSIRRCVTRRRRGRSWACGRRSICSDR